MALPIINLSLIPVFPAKVSGDGPVTIIKNGLEYVVGWDIETFSVNPNPGANSVVLSHDPDANETGLISISDIATPVIDSRLADQATAEAGADNVKLMTPLRSKQSIVANAKDGKLLNDRTIGTRITDIVSLADYDNLTEARTAASVKPLVDPTSGRVSVNYARNPTFDLGAGVLGVAMHMWSGDEIVIPAGKNFAWLRASSDDGDELVYTLQGSDSIAGHFEFYATSSAASAAGSNLYGGIGLLTLEGPGTAKGWYSRVRAVSGATGVIVATVSGVETVSGLSYAAGHQISVLTPSGKLDAGLWMHGTPGTPAKANYGILLQDIAIEAGGAALQLSAHGLGDFLRLNNADNSANLFVVDKDGVIRTDLHVGASKTNGVKVSTAAVERTAAAGNFQIMAGAGGTLYLGDSVGQPLLVTSSSISLAGTTLAFFGGAPTGKPTVIGSRADDTWRVSLMNALSAAGLNLITDSTTA